MNIIDAVLSERAADLSDLLRNAPSLASTRFEHEMFLDAVGHQFYAGDTPLHVAAAGICLASAKTLLEAGADADARNRRGASPLHYAADPRPSDGARWRPAEQESLMKLLIAHGGDRDGADKSGVRPLHRAVRRLRPAAVRFLLDAGCDARARAGKLGSTPLHLAVGSTGASGTAGSTGLQAEIAGLLIDAGARLSDIDGRGQTALDRIRSSTLRDALANLGVLD